MIPSAMQLIDLRVKVRAYCGCNFPQAVCILQCPSDVGEVTTGGHVNMAFFATEDSKAMIGVITPDAPFVRHMVLVCGICKRA